MFGGTGSFADALLAGGLAAGRSCWCCRSVQLVLHAAVAAAGRHCSGSSGLVLFLWLLTNFVAELHGFRSLLAVFGGIVARLIADRRSVLAILLLLILAFGAEA